MITKTIYVANDGTEFETEDECLQYESSLTAMSEFVQFYDHNFQPIEWNPENYESMWDHLHYIVIEPHREAEVEEWWGKTFCTMLGVSPFGDLECDWSCWLKVDHGDEPTILAYDFDGGNSDWVILNEIYSKARNIIKSLNLVDALS